MKLPTKPLLPLTLLLTLTSTASAQRIDRWLSSNESCYGGADISAYTDTNNHILRLTYHQQFSSRDLFQEFIFQNSKLIRVNERVAIPDWNDKTQSLDYSLGSLIYRRYEITNGNLTSFHHIGDDDWIKSSTAAELLHDANLYKKFAHAPEK